MVIDVTKSAGKAMLSIALTAKSSGQKVTAYGANVCDLWDTHETINLLYLK